MEVMTLPRTQEDLRQPLASSLKLVVSQPSLYIDGIGGRVGADLRTISQQSGIDVVDEPEQAEFIALCTPARIAADALRSHVYDEKVVIDLSGASKRMKLGQYGLMLSAEQPWDRSLDTNREIFGNPGCISSAVIRGLANAGLVGMSLPRRIHVTSIGGLSHVMERVEGLSLANRLNTHPHAEEIEQAFERRLEVASFTPVVCDTPHGMIVSISGETDKQYDLHKGYNLISSEDSAHTNTLRHRLEINPRYPNLFSLVVTIDNIRFVTQNATQLIKYIYNHKS